MIQQGWNKDGEKRRDMSSVHRQAKRHTCRDKFPAARMPFYTYPTGPPRPGASKVSNLRHICRNAAYFSASFKSSSVTFSIYCTLANSKRLWPLPAPLQRLGQGRPWKDSLAPSVPPRIGLTTGSPPSSRMASEALYGKWYGLSGKNQKFEIRIF